MERRRIAVVSQSDVFAAGIQRILSAGGKFEVLRVSGSIASVRRYLPLYAVVLDSASMAKVNLQKLLSVQPVPGIRVICVESDANRAVVYDRELAEFQRAGDVLDLLTVGITQSEAGSQDVR